MGALALHAMAAVRSWEAQGANYNYDAPGTGAPDTLWLQYTGAVAGLVARCKGCLLRWCLLMARATGCKMRVGLLRAEVLHASG